MYTLDLTAADIDTIAFVGDRYSWSAILAPYVEGRNEIPEHEAWNIQAAFLEDTEGGHSMFPMLDRGSKLYAKLIFFWEGII